MKINGKNKLLGIGIMAGLALSYSLAIKKTFVLKNQSRQLAIEVAQFTDIPNRLAVLHQKNRYYDSILGSIDINSTSLQNNLIRTVNIEAERHMVKVMDFKQPHFHKLRESGQYTYQFNLEGNYTDILKVVHLLEQKGNFGEIVHLDFEKKKDYRTSRDFLNAMVMVQQLK